MNLGPGRACFYQLQEDCEQGFHVGDPDLAETNMTLWGSGAGGVNVSFSFSDVSSGLSNFVVVDEIRAGVHELDPRGSWALGFPGASATVRHGIIDRNEDAYGPNNQNAGSDDIVGCEQLHAVVGPAKLKTLRMPCHSNTPEDNSQATARSMHPGGVHVLMLDGSTHFVSDSVNLDVWYQMHCRDTEGDLVLPFH